MAATTTAPETLELVVTEAEAAAEESGHGVLRAVLIAVGVAAVVAAVVAVVSRRRS